MAAAIDQWVSQNVSAFLIVLTIFNAYFVVADALWKTNIQERIAKLERDNG